MVDDAVRSPPVRRAPWISTTRRKRRIAVTALALGALSACDTGDGTTLRTPTAPTTLPPVESAPLPSEVIDDAADEAAPESTGAAPPSTAALPGDGSGEIADDAQLFTPWADGGTIDLRYTCDGSNAAPALSWTGIPAGAAELAISMVDESDLSSGRPFIHWVMSGIDPGLDRLAENEVPPGAVQGINFFGDVGYTGPCPDPGTTGTFVLTVFALGQQLEFADETPAAELLDVIGTVAIGAADSTGTVTR